MSSLQRTSGKKVGELEFMKKAVMAPVAVKTRRTSKEFVIRSAKKDASCNLLIWAACCDIANRTIVAPRIKSVAAGSTQGKGDKLGFLNVETQSRENPEASRGLFVTRGILGQAKLVQEARQQKKEIDEAKKETNVAKMQSCNEEVGGFLWSHGENGWSQKSQSSR
jgi:hypothetical protein